MDGYQRSLTRLAHFLDDPDPASITAEDIPMPKATTRAVSPLSEEEIRDLLEGCEYMR
jgi:hypothetical protein